MKLQVLINGTDVGSPRAVVSLVDPRPQILTRRGRAFDYADRQVQRLANPGQTEESIRRALQRFHPVFVEMVVRAHQPGQITTVEIEIPDAVVEKPPWRG